MRIAVDCDGVIFNFSKEVVRIANTFMPTPLPDSYEPSDWGYTGVFTKEQWSEVWKRIRETENFWLGLSAYEKNCQALREFWDLNPGTDIFFVTSRVETRGETVLAQTAQALNDRGLYPRFGHASVIPVSNANEKVNVMRAAGIQFSLDDYPETVQQCNLLGNHKAYLLSRKWNQELETSRRVTSVRHYLDVISETEMKVTA